MAKLKRVSAVAGMANLTLRVRITRVRELRLRIWIAMLLMKLAARVMNCGISIEREEDGNP